ncbi:MAG: GyrI-like domain-containing protein [Janthinobacterium lividum]
MPDGFTVMPIPAASYAVFRIVLNGGPVHPQVRAAMAAVWGVLIPGADLTVADTPDFERHHGEFAPTKPGATIDFHVPIIVSPIARPARAALPPAPGPRP